MTQRLKRTAQCAKCPWRVDTDPYDIPNGYSKKAHEALSGTIADPHNPTFTPGPAMSCHEHNTEDQVFCVGWLAHQLGPGNNIAMRLQAVHIENIGELRLRGEQHTCFEDTIPED